MQVLVVRHAIAEQQEEFARTGKDDSQRPLTDDGRRKMRRGAAGKNVIPRRLFTKKRSDEGILEYL